MKNKRRLVPLLFAFVFALSMQLPTMATVPGEVASMQYIPIQPFWQNVNSATVRLSFSGTTAHCSSTIVGLSGTSSISATMKLQRVNGNTVTTVSTWNHSVNGNRLVISESATINTSNTYRLVVDATVVRNGVSESITITG